MYLTGRWLEGDPAREFCFAQIAKPGPRRREMAASIVATSRSIGQLRGALARIAQAVSDTVASYERFGAEQPWGFTDPTGWKCSARYLRGVGQLPPVAPGCSQPISTGIEMSGDMLATVASMPFTAKKISGNEVRVPDPRPGEATVISRYGKERAIVIHPSDFERLNGIEQLLAQAATLEPIVLSEEAVRAHSEEGTPQEPITDPALLAELFG